MYEQMENLCREEEILRDKRTRREIKRLKQMKNVFGGLISRLDTAEERISEVEDVSIETLQTEKQTEKTGEKKKQNPEENIQELWGNYKGVTYA